MGAVELKLSEQRKFILWWDRQEKEHGGGDVRNSTRIRPVTGVQASDFGTSRPEIHRWRVRLKDDKKYQAALAGPATRRVY